METLLDEQLHALSMIPTNVTCVFDRPDHSALQILSAQQNTPPAQNLIERFGEKCHPILARRLGL